MWLVCYRENTQSIAALISHHSYLVLLQYLRKCSSLEIAWFHSKCCITALPVWAVAAWFLQTCWLILMLMYDSLNLIISGVHQSHVSCWSHRSEKVKLRGLDNVAYKMCQCAVLPKNNIIIYIVFGSY